jgi:hypothetical protein
MFVLLPDRLSVLPSEPPSFNYRGWSVTVDLFPKVLLRHRIDQIRFYRDEEVRRFTCNSEHYDGRNFHPEYRVDKRNIERKEEYR